MAVQFPFAQTAEGVRSFINRPMVTNPEDVILRIYQRSMASNNEALIGILCDTPDLCLLMLRVAIAQNNQPMLERVMQADLSQERLQQALLRSLTLNNFAFAGRLVERGALVTSEILTAALRDASVYGNQNLIRYVLDHPLGISPEARVQAIVQCASSGHFDCMDVVLTADVVLPHDAYITILHAGLHHRRGADFFRRILPMGERSEEENSRFTTALYHSHPSIDLIRFGRENFGPLNDATIRELLHRTRRESLGALIEYLLEGKTEEEKNSFFTVLKSVCFSDLFRFQELNAYLPQTAYDRDFADRLYDLAITSYQEIRQNDLYEVFQSLPQHFPQELRRHLAQAFLIRITQDFIRDRNHERIIAAVNIFHPHLGEQSERTLQSITQAIQTLAVDDLVGLIRASYVRNCQPLLRIALDNLLTLPNIEVSFQSLLDLRDTLPSTLLIPMVQQLLERATPEVRQRIQEQLTYGSRCCEVPAQYRSQVTLPPLPADCRIEELLAAIDALSWRRTADGEIQVENRERVDELFNGSLARSLLRSLDYQPLTQEAYEACTQEQKEFFEDIFDLYDLRRQQREGYCYENYRASCLMLQESYQKLTVRIQSLIPQTGQPDLSRPEDLKNWYKQVFTHLCYLELCRRKMLPQEQFELTAQLCSTTSGCASKTQSGISQVFSQHSGIEFPMDPVLRLFLRELDAAHRDASTKVKADYGFDSHRCSEIDHDLAPFGFQNYVSDGMTGVVDRAAEFISRFHTHYRLRELVATIQREFASDSATRGAFISRLPSPDLTQDEVDRMESQLSSQDLTTPISELMENFRSRFIEELRPLTSNQERQVLLRSMPQGTDLTPDDWISQLTPSGRYSILRRLTLDERLRMTSQLTQEERRMIPPSLSYPALHEVYLARHGSSASAATPTFEEFAREERRTALPSILRRLQGYFQEQAFGRTLDEKIELAQIDKSPLAADGRIKAEAIVNWLIEQGFFKGPFD